jgi:hypothetical protein
MRNLLSSIAIIIFLFAIAASCGDDDDASSDATPTVPPTSSPAPAATTAAPSGEITLDVESVEPEAVQLGDTVTVTFVTSPGAVIGLRVFDGEGSVVSQDQLTAGDDGRAPYDFVAEGAVGTWLVSAAAGATVQDLLALQASPVPGPYSVDQEIEVQ